MSASSAASGSPGPLPGSLGRAAALPGRALRALHGLWRRLRAWRRIRFTPTGLVFTLGTFVVGFPAMNTGNNLLYLLMGSMLGLIAVSGWLSERTIRALEIHRKVPKGVTVGRPVRIEYRVENHKERLGSFAVDLAEQGLPGRAFLPTLAAGGSTTVRSLNHFRQRGVYPLDTVTVSTSFPFGFFRKERDLELADELVIWPRTDRSVRAPEPAGGKARQSGELPAGDRGSRGEYRGLREYRPGDDPRDIHWRTTARLAEPVIREYERDSSDTLRICLDLRAEPGPRAEAAVEVAASLAAQASRGGTRFGLTTPDVHLEPASGPGQLEWVLDALARVDFDPRSAPVRPRVHPSQCVLVSARGDRGGGFGDVYTPLPEASE